MNRQGIHQRLADRKIEVAPWHEMVFDEGLLEGRVTLREVRGLGECVIEDVTLLTHATPRFPNDALVVPLREAGVKVSMIGDAHAPRSLLVATAEGYRCAMAL